MPRVQKFGGNHTERKLVAVADYLNAYVTVMKKQPFNLTYVDGFAGSGASQPLSDEVEDQLQGVPLFDASSIVEGSPTRALNVEPPFDRYVFIDSNPKNVESLKSLLPQYPGRVVNIVEGDANDRLLAFSKWMQPRRLERAVVFLDPFGLSVRWETIASLAATEKVDLWYLVPVQGMSRQIKSDGTFLQSAQKIDEIWGSTEWRGQAVKQGPLVEDLFGSVDQRLEKVARAEQFSEMFRQRLGEVFKGGVAKRYLRLGRGRSHDFSLMFACANPSPSAWRKALRIADHILDQG